MKYVVIFTGVFDDSNEIEQIKEFIDTPIEEAREEYDLEDGVIYKIEVIECGDSGSMEKVYEEIIDKSLLGDE